MYAVYHDVLIPSRNYTLIYQVGIRPYFSYSSYQCHEVMSKSGPRSKKAALKKASIP